MNKVICVLLIGIATASSFDDMERLERLQWRLYDLSEPQWKWQNVWIFAFVLLVSTWSQNETDANTTTCEDFYVDGYYNVDPAGDGDFFEVYCSYSKKRLLLLFS